MELARQRLIQRLWVGSDVCEMQAPGLEEMNLAEVRSASKRLPSELLCRN